MPSISTEVAVSTASYRTSLGLHGWHHLVSMFSHHHFLNDLSPRENSEEEEDGEIPKQQIPFFFFSCRHCL